MGRITDGLMTWAAEYPLPKNGMACVRAIADEIERTLEDELGGERAKVESEYYGWYPPLEVEEIKADRERLFKACAEKNEEITRLVMSAGDTRAFVDRIRAAAEDREDVTLFGTDYLAYPLDADGEPIHVGDVLDPPPGCDDYAPLQVMRLTYDGYEDEWFFDGDVGGFCGMVGKHMDTAGWTCHSHKPAVEDVLREFADRVCSGDHLVVKGAYRALEDSGLLAEYAAKLRLAGDTE